MKSKEKFDLSIIIVNYNTRELLRACLRSLNASDKHLNNFEIVVVDNASKDGSLEMVAREFPAVKRIALGANMGFAAANNRGIKTSTGRYILLLNSDTEVPPDVLHDLICYMDEHDDVGALTCLLKLSDGSMDPACHRGFPTPWASLTYFVGLEKLFGSSRFFGQYHQGYKPAGKIHDVDCISGAFFLIRREVIDRVGLLDEKFFMYGEDIDWCYRIREAGWKIRFYPNASILHKKHQSGLANVDDELRGQTRKHFYDAMRLFYSKHYRHRYSPFVSSLVLFGIKFRSFI